MYRHLTNQRGSVFAYTAIAMGVFLALTVAAVDIGRLAFTATEVQTVADIAATAGARRLLRNRQTGASDSPVTDAQNVVASGGNKLDGQTASIAPADVQVGSWNFQTSTFSSGGTPVNAVRANPHKTVNNFVAAILGAPQTTVDKIATAAMSGPGAGRANLPIAIQDCQFAAYQSSGNCSSLPTLTAAPSGNSCWTSLSPTNGNVTTAATNIPSSCCANGNNCGGLTPGELVGVLNVGSPIGDVPGNKTPLFVMIADCYAQGIREWTIPIVPCGQCGSGSPILGFAHIVITSPPITNGPNQGINLSVICRTDDPGGGGGGGDFGLLDVNMVN